MGSMSFEFQFCPEIQEINRSDWDQLAKPHYPFLQYDFLWALEESKSVCAETGWQPFHLQIKKEDKTIGLMPLYIKTHSYGEYIFDWSWADAYRRYGFEYYPKLLCAIPFTPVTASRLLTAEGTCHSDLWKLALSVLEKQCGELGLSSVHLLYPDQALSDIPVADEWCQRHSVQFQWFNRGYTNFDDFLGDFASRKRKNVKKERKKVVESQVIVERFHGDNLEAHHLEFFYECYQETYLKRSGHTGYLKEAFFKHIFESMQDSILIVQASKSSPGGDASRPIASALYFFDQQGLYGRYWGAIEEMDCLHFECCYYQGIEFAIEQQIPIFNPGTQGEHKIQRGFSPTMCYSNHWLANPDFNDAIHKFVANEHQHIAQYKQDAEQLLPFKKEF